MKPISSAACRQDRTALEFDHVEVAFPRGPGDLHHVRGSALGVPDRLSVPDRDQRPFRRPCAKRYLQDPAIADGGRGMRYPPSEKLEIIRHDSHLRFAEKRFEPIIRRT